MSVSIRNKLQVEVSGYIDPLNNIWCSLVTPDCVVIHYDTKIKRLTLEETEKNDNTISHDVHCVLIDHDERSIIVMYPGIDVTKNARIKIKGLPFRNFKFMEECNKYGMTICFYRNSLKENQCIWWREMEKSVPRLAKKKEES